MAKKLKVPVVALRRHDRIRMVGDIYGLDQEFVKKYVKMGLVKLNLLVLENEDAPEAVKDLVEQFQAELGDGTREVVEAKENEAKGGRRDPRLAKLNELPYNRGSESIVGFAKAVAEHLGVELNNKSRDQLTDFLLTNYETLEDLQAG